MKLLLIYSFLLLFYPFVRGLHIKPRESWSQKLQAKIDRNAPGKPVFIEEPATDHLLQVLGPKEKKGVRKCTKTLRIYGVSMFYADLNVDELYRGGLKMTNPKKFDMVAVISTRGFWIERISIDMENDVTEEEQRRTPDGRNVDLQRNSYWEHYIGSLALGLTRIPTKGIQRKVVHKAECTLHEFLTRVKKEGGEYVTMLEITQPKDSPSHRANPHVWGPTVDIMKRHIAEVLEPTGKVESQKITLNLIGSDLEQNTLSIYTYRESQPHIPDRETMKAQIVSANYGAEGITALIPLSTEAETLPSRAKEDTSGPWPAECHLSFDPKTPSARSGKLGETCNQPTVWFHTVPGVDDSQLTKHNVFVVITSFYRFWVLVVPFSWVKNEGIYHANNVGVIEEKGRTAFNNLKAKHLEDSKDPNSFATFYKKMADDEEILSVNTISNGLGNTNEGEVNQVWRQENFSAGVLWAIRNMARSKFRSDLNTVAWIDAGDGINRNTNAYAIETIHIQGRPSPQLQVVYRHQQQLKLNKENILDRGDGFQGKKRDWNSILSKARELFPSDYKHSIPMLLCDD